MSEPRTAEALVVGGDSPWWRRAVIYQVYPRSYQDSDGDGVGDLKGVVRRLDHLVWLGVDALWLSPFFLSPMKDFGYDVADYCAVDPLFGTMADAETLIAEAHARGIRVILDLVPNHTSDQHAWFAESRRSRESPKRDWYLWRDPAPDGGPPNNWLSEFGGSAWALDPGTGQYYYHAFLAEQPDLNWRNSAVREAMYAVMRFWLDRGVDGFRVDVLWHLLKDDQYRDNPPNPDWQEGMAPTRRLRPEHTTDLPDVQQIVREMRGVLDAYDERVLIGEIYLPFERLVRYYGESLDGAHLPFNFALVDAPWDARHVERLVADYEKALPAGAWPNWVLGNHDKPRVAGRLGEPQARLAAMLLLTLRGTPTIYYGDEIGMGQGEFLGDAARDPFEIAVPGFGLGRDGARTPMAWTEEPGAGFSPGPPWLPLLPDTADRNVATQKHEPRSMLHLHRRLIALRRANLALTEGAYRSLAAEGDLVLYLREASGKRFLVALNLSEEPIRAELGNGFFGRVAVSSLPDRDGERVAGTLDLRPSDGLVVELDAAG